MNSAIACIAATLTLMACTANNSMPSPSSDPRAEQLRKLAEAEAALPLEVREKLAELRKKSEALPRPSRLDVATIRSIKDEDLDFAISWYFGERLRTTNGSREAVLRNETPAFRNFYLSWLLEAEVLNGGFNQYFWNISPELVELTPEAVRAIGDTDALRLFALAVKRAEAEAPKRAELKAQRTLQAFSDSYKSSMLQEYDERFVALAASFAARRVAYVRANEGGLAEHQ